jgi:pimeloyl-ACP methyl ester carboxylesterase
MPYARNGDVQIYYQLHYADSAPLQKPALVMIRGLARSSRFWLDFLPRITKSFSVITLDNRGVGRSDSPRRPYTTRAMADDVAAVLDAAKLERANIVGISLGGMVAMRFALNHPARVQKLVLGCTTMGGRDAVKISPAAIRRLLGAAPLSFADAMTYTAPIVLSEQFLQDRPDILNAWRAIAIAEPVSTRGALWQMLAGAEHDVSREVHRISAPTLLLTGDADKLIDAENSVRLAAKIPRSKLVYLSGAGHDFPTEQPDNAAAEIESFVLG